MAEFNEHDGRGGRERGRGGRDMRRPNRDEQREERRREAARHTGLMKAAFCLLYTSPRGTTRRAISFTKSPWRLEPTRLLPATSSISPRASFPS